MGAASVTPARHPGTSTANFTVLPLRTSARICTVSKPNHHHLIRSDSLHGGSIIMSRSLVGRLPRFLSLGRLAPRVSPPLLPLAAGAGRLSPRELTRTPRISSMRLFHGTPTSRLSPTRISFENSASHEPLPPNATLGQRLKHLVRAYGWYALGVYIVVSTIDFSVSLSMLR